MTALSVRSSHRRRLAFAALAIALAVAVSSATLLAIDVYLHGRYERSAGFNVWGYRGPAVGRKGPNEYRVVVLGGSAAYGYGVPWEQAMPAVLERQLRARSTSPVFTVINLAYNNEGAYSFKPTLQDYRSLHYDLVLLYEGYNDLIFDERQPNVAVFRHDSPVFRLTGYMPIFPIIFEEKAAAMLNGGDAGARYRQQGKTVFHASLATQAAAGVLDAAASVAQSLERQLGKVSAEPVHHIDNPEAAGCVTPWRAYCQSIAVAVEFAREQGKHVLVVTQPYLAVNAAVRALHMAQQSELRAMTMRRFGSDPSVRYVDLGTAVDLTDSLLSFDHMHLTARGNEQLAAALVDAVIDLAARSQKTS
jgi:lysophospholipase L1-like esterase